MSEPRCQICLRPLEDSSELYHPACCQKLFGSRRPPVFPYTWQDLNALAEQVVRQHVTVPGVQPKLLLHLERAKAGQDARFTLVGLDGGFILKPPVDRFPEMPELEHVTLRMARCFDISTAECGLIAMEGGQLCFVTRRMDRDGAAKLHMEDMCQLTDRLTEEKYRGSLEQVGKVILRHCHNPVFDALRFFELTLFCFLTGNADMHLKNFSLLYPLRGEIMLSSAYDLVPTALLLPEDREESALTLNGRKRRFRRRDFDAFGAALKLSAKQIENTYKRFSGKRAAALDVLQASFCSADAQQRYASLLNDRADRLGLA